MALPPIPYVSAVVDSARKVLWDWHQWFQTLAATVNATAQRLISVSLATQSATVTAGSLTPGTMLAAGLYRVTYAAQITRTATSSSSLTVAFTWVSGGVTQAFIGDPMTGNTTTTQQGAVVPMIIDAATDLAYTLTYASSGVQAMRYNFSAALETVPA